MNGGDKKIRCVMGMLWDTQLQHDAFQYDIRVCLEMEVPFWVPSIPKDLAHHLRPMKFCTVGM